MRLVNKLEKLVEQQKKGEKLPNNWKNEVKKLAKDKVRKRRKLQHTVIHSPKSSERKKAWKKLDKIDKELERIEKYVLKLVGESYKD